MESLFFWIFAIGLICCAASVIINRNPVASALSLALAFGCQAALFVTLHAFFLAAVEVIVYAGAVMVLFLFIIMLLDIKAAERRPFPWLAAMGTGAVLIFFAIFFVRVLASMPHGTDLVVAQEAIPYDGARMLGSLLFTRYMMPFLCAGALLLLATVGVVLLSKKDLK